MNKKLITGISAGVLLLGCAILMRPKGLNPVTHIEDFESEDSLQNWDLKRITQDHSFEYNKDIVFKGKQSARFELRSGERVSDGWRTELRDPWHAPNFETTWYKINFFVPEDFPIEKENSCIFAQWHDQKDKGDGTRNPPIAIRLRGHGELVITARYNAKKLQGDEPGVQVILYSDPNFKRGEWNSFVMEAHWDYTEKGFVNIWRNGQQIVNYKGPIGYNDDLGPYVKIGVYCRETPKYPLAVYHDDFRRSLKEEVIKKD